MDDVVYPEFYGAVGDGLTDDGPALQAAIDAAISLRKPLFLSNKVYATAQELICNSTQHMVIRGVPILNGRASTLKARSGSGLRSVLTVKLTGRFEDFSVDGSNEALVGLYLQECSLAQFRGISVASCLRDGFYLCGEKDTTHYCSSGVPLAALRSIRAGAIWVRAVDRTQIAGTCSVVSGNATITFTGAPNLTALGLTAGGVRPARVYVKNGSSALYLGSLASISAASLTVASAPTFTAAGCEFVLCNDVGAINDTNSFQDVSAGGCGALWASATVFSEYTTAVPNRTSVPATTVAVTSASPIVTFSGGSLDLWVLGVRPGDLMFVGDAANRRMVMVLSVPTPQTIAVDTAFDFSASGLSWAIGQGDGIHECQNADNNVNSFSGTGLIRGCAGSGLAFAGFYGPRVDGFQIDYCGMAGVRVGLTTCIGPMLSRVYVESTGPTGWNKGFYLTSCQGAIVLAPHDATGVAETSVQLAGGTNGIWMDRYGQYALGVGYRSTLETTGLFNATMNGPLTVSSTEYNNTSAGWSLSSVMTPGVFVLSLDPSGANRIFAGTPTLSHPRGFLLVQCKFGQSFTITFRDELALGGTKLRLQTPEVRLSQGESLLLYSDGVTLWEVSRSHTNSYDYGDTSAVAGSATSNFSRGKSKLASGTAAITITSARVYSQSLVAIEWEADPGARHWVTVTSGSFTIGLATAPAADKVFRWKVED